MKKHKRVINLEPIKEKKEKEFSLKVRNAQIDVLKMTFVRPVDWVVDEKDIETGELTDYAQYKEDLAHLESKAKILRGKGYKYKIVRLFEESK